MSQPRRTLIVGTAGRDFHVFNTTFRHNAHHLVLGFTSSQLRQGAARYPACLSGSRYPDGIPIVPEADLESFIAAERVEKVVFAYTELGCLEIARLAARVLAAGADFQLVSPARLMLPASKPVIAVTAARTGAGKSPTVRYLADLLLAEGRRVAVIRHPLHAPEFGPDWSHHRAGDTDPADACAEPDVAPLEGQPRILVYSGIDQASVLAAAEKDADVVLWDGAGNDLPFIRPDLHILLTDPLHVVGEAESFPGDVSLRLADVVIISKCDTASAAQVDELRGIVANLNSEAVVLTADSPVIVEGAGLVAERTVVVVEEELTLNLGSLRPGAGMAAALQVGVSAIISPLPQAVGTLAEVYVQHPEAHSLLPVSGYSDDELAEVRATIMATPSDAVIDATRVDLAGLLGLDRPVAKAWYSLRPHDPEALARLVRGTLAAR